MSVLHHFSTTPRRPDHGIRRFAAMIGVWCDRLRGRRCLLRMNDRELKDLGISRYDAQYEARKPFWRA